MKLGIAIWICAWTITSFAPSHGADSAPGQRHVILITIDGFPASMLADPKTHIPNIRELAARGSVAKGMRVSNPSVTWPNHTTLVTGVRAEKHSVLYNGILTRQGPDVPVAVDPKRTKEDLVAVPTVYDFLHGKGFRTAAINWPSTRGAKTLDDDFPDVPDSIQHSTPRLRQELIEKRILHNDKDTDFRSLVAPARDEIWTAAAVHVINHRQPNLLLFHLLNIDGTHHRYGPQSPASYTALALADVHVGKILDALDAAGIRSNTTILLTADHGFATVTNVIYPNVLFRKTGRMEVGASNLVTKARAQMISEGGTGMVYLNNPETRDADRKKVIELLRGAEGIAAVIEPRDYAQHGYPSPEKNPGMADLVLAAKDGYGFSAAATGELSVRRTGITDNAGYHGFLASNPKMNALFIASGRGIKKGAELGLVDCTDIAPTIAHLLGEKFENADGQILRELLE